MNKKQLLAQLAQLQAENEALKTHAPFGILTRQGLEMERRHINGARYAVFGDIDGMHELNQAHGYEEVNRMIRQALQLRTDDLLLTGLWFSGDEIVFIIKGNPEGFMDRVRESFIVHGLGITLAYAAIENNNLNQAIDSASQMVQAAKAQRKNERK